MRFPLALISSVLSPDGTLTLKRAQDPQAHLSGPSRPGRTGQRSAALRGSRCVSHVAGSAAGAAAVQARGGEFCKICLTVTQVCSDRPLRTTGQLV